MMSLHALALGIVCIVTASCGTQAFNHPRGTGSSISPDEIAVYETVLTSWLSDERSRQLINEELSAPPSKQDPEFSDCTKGLNFPAATEANQGKKSLVGIHFKRRGIELVDRSKWKPADPGEAIANGDSVDLAVRMALFSVANFVLANCI